MSYPRLGNRHGLPGETFRLEFDSTRVSAANHFGIRAASEGRCSRESADYTKLLSSRQSLKIIKSLSSLLNTLMRLFMKDQSEKNKSICIITTIILMSSHLSLLSWEKAIGVLNARKAMTQKHSTAVTRYANAASLKGVVELLRKQDGESADNVIEFLPAMTAILTTHDPTKQVSLFVKSIINVRHATKSCLTRKEGPMLTCVEKSCVGTVKSMLILIHICVT